MEKQVCRHEACIVLYSSTEGYLDNNYILHTTYLGTYVPKDLVALGSHQVVNDAPSKLSRTNYLITTLRTPLNTSRYTCYTRNLYTYMYTNYT